MSAYINIIYLLIIWFAGWGIYFISAKKRMRLGVDADLSTVYFLFLATLSFFILKNNPPSALSGGGGSEFLEDNIFFYLALMTAVFFTVNHFYFIIRHKFKEPFVEIEEHPTDLWLSANRKSIFVTLSHILFQQMIMTGIALFLWKKTGDLWQTAWLFSLIFGAMHVLLIFFKGFKFMILYTLPAMAAGLLYPVILIKLGTTGFAVNYILHSFFYVLLTYIFWHKEGRIQL